MISADDAEYPREYRTLGNGTRRFSNVGLVHTSERRHTVIAAQSLEALTGLQKSEMERKRDAFMDHLKNKYPQHALALRGQQERMRDQVRGRLLGEGGGHPTSPRGAVRWGRGSAGAWLQHGMGAPLPQGWGPGADFPCTGWIWSRWLSVEAAGVCARRQRDGCDGLKVASPRRGGGTHAGLCRFRLQLRV